MSLTTAMIIAYIPFVWGVWQQIKVDNRNNSVTIRRYDEVSIDKDDAL